MDQKITKLDPTEEYLNYFPSHIPRQETALGSKWTVEQVPAV